MNFYSIKDLETYSGIKAHTIRIWEKRYNMLHPVRTDSNIRKYNDQQLIKLLNVVTLLESGWKISKISKLDEKALLAETEKVLNDYEDAEFNIPISGLITAMFAFDEQEFLKIINACHQKIGLYNTFKEVIYPLLHRIGMMWRTEEISPAQEHFISNLVRRKLVTEINQISDRQNYKETYVLFLPEDEYHEIGLLLANYLLRKMDKKIVYLGANTPLSCVDVVYAKLAPQYLLTFMITKKDPEEMSEYLHDMQVRYPNSQILLACHPNSLDQVTLPAEIIPLHCVEALENQAASKDSVLA